MPRMLSTKWNKPNKLNFCLDEGNHKIVDSIQTLASDFETKSTNPKPRCASSPGVIFLGMRIDFSSPNALNKSRTSFVFAWNGIFRTRIFDPVCFSALAVLRFVFTSVLERKGC